MLAKELKVIQMAAISNNDIKSKMFDLMFKAEQELEIGKKPLAIAVSPDK